MTWKQFIGSNKNRSNNHNNSHKRQHDDITVIKAHKGNTTAAMETKAYFEKANSFPDGSVYSELKKDLTTTIQNQCNRIWINSQKKNKKTSFELKNL